MTTDLLIQGSNVHVFKYVESLPLEIVCATDMTLTINQEMIGATTPDSGIYKERRPRLIDFSLSLSGASTSDNDGDISIFYMLNNIREAHDLQIVFTDNIGNERTFRADFYIETNDLTAPADEASTYELSLLGTGPYFLSELLDPSTTGTQVGSGTFVVSGGVVTDPDLEGVLIIGVWREGTNLESMGISYTYNSGTGTITPDPATTEDGQRIFVIWMY